MIIEKIKSNEIDGLKISGDLTHKNAIELTNALKKEIKFVDLTNTNFIDGFVLSILIIHEKNNSGLTILNKNQDNFVNDLLNITALDKIFRVVDHENQI